MKHSVSGISVVGIVVGILALCAPVGAATPAVEARVAGASSVFYDLSSDFGTADLRVTGPGDFLFEKVFERGAEVRFELVDGADGVYRWSLTHASPVDPRTAQALAAARASGDTGLAERLKAEGLFAAGTESGTFLVIDGRVILPEASVGGSDRDLSTEALPTKDLPTKDLPTKDQVIADDLIVTRSVCVGFNCVDGEDFGFDTIRLKENNLRIKFEDTSVNNFPSNDWQLTANSSDNGGASYFSIDDVDGGTIPFRVEAGAPSHTVYADSTGRVGFGTSTPVVELHTVSGDTPTLRLQQDGSGGFSPQVWDVAGNDAGFFIRDATFGSALPFRILPSADSATLVIDGDSQVGVGTVAPTHKLHVRESGGLGVLQIAGTFENNGPVSLQLLDSNSGDNWVFSNKPTGFEISKGGTGVNELALNGDGDLTIQGQLTTEMGVYPDYVFEEGYELLPLDDLARFIEANGHLPNIRPEAEVENGKRVNLSELSRGLLEKVEELTLYTLEQHRTDRELRGIIEAQSHTIRELEARLEALEAER